MNLTLEIAVEGHALRVRVFKGGTLHYEPGSPELRHAYALLALIRCSATPERLVNAEELQSLPIFANSKLSSIGASFGSRHIGTQCKARGLTELFYFQNITKAWRLQIASSDIVLYGGTEKIRAALHLSASQLPSTQAHDFSWAGHAVRCLLATDYKAKIKLDVVQAGRAALNAAGNDPLRSMISRFLQVRAASHHSAEAYENAVEKLLDAINDNTDENVRAIGRSVRLRTIALGHFARRHDPFSWANAITDLHLNINEAKSLSDFGALALLYEVIAIIMVRQKPFDTVQRAQVSEYFQSAIALQIHCRDTVRLQTVLHNAANFESVATTSWRVPALRWQIEQVELALLMANVAKVHSASAQTYCLLLMLYASNGQFEHALMQAQLADQALADLKNPIEHAHRAYAQGHLHWWQYDLLGKQPEHKRQALVHLERARELFHTVPDHLYEITLTTQIRHLKADQVLTREAMQAAFEKG